MSLCSNPENKCEHNPVWGHMPKIPDLGGLGKVSLGYRAIPCYVSIIITIRMMKTVDTIIRQSLGIILREANSRHCV